MARPALSSRAQRGIRSRNKFFDMLSNLAKQDKGVMIITHDLEMARRVLVLKAGELVYDGPPTDDLPQLLA